MLLRARFAFLLFALSILPTAGVLSQDAAPQAAARVSKTHCEILTSCVEKVLYFSNISQPSDLQDVVNAIRVIADVQRVQPLVGASIIIIEGTPEQVALSEKIAAEIDKDKRRFGGFGYRIDLKIQESEGDRRLHSRLYSFVSEARQAATLTIKRPAPEPAQKEPSENHPVVEPDNTRRIECRIFVESERTLEMGVDAEFTSDAGNASSGGTSPILRIRENVIVELDKPMVISRIDDPDSGHTFTLELTASRIKDRS
jgi:hypothetical protein